MIVTELVPFGKNRFKITLDGQLTFVLYKGELSRFSITSGGEVSSELYQRIKQEVLIKRAKARALHLLNIAPRTEKELAGKLREGGYPQEVAQEALVYVKSFGYLDDAAYALHFILHRKERKSKREIRAAIAGKGIAPDILEDAFREAYRDQEEGGGEDAAIARILERKGYWQKKGDSKEEARILGYLARKGFRYEDVRRVIQDQEPLF